MRRNDRGPQEQQQTSLTESAQPRHDSCLRFPTQLPMRGTCLAMRSSKSGVSPDLYRRLAALAPMAPPSPCCTSLARSRPPGPAGTVRQRSRRVRCRRPVIRRLKTVSYQSEEPIQKERDQSVVSKPLIVLLNCFCILMVRIKSM